jgi:hypothetical protein
MFCSLYARFDEKSGGECDTKEPGESKPVFPEGRGKRQNAGAP